MSAKYKAEEVAKHNDTDDLWIVLHGKVYNVTKFLTEHPGGEEVLIALAGQDATKCFDEIGHSEEALQLKDTYMIGELEGSLLPPAGAPVTNGKQATHANGAQASGSNGKEATIDDDNWTYEELKNESSAYSPAFVTIAVLVYAVLFYYMYQHY